MYSIDTDEWSEGAATTTARVASAWCEIKDDDSKICKLLTHQVFQKSEGVIDANALISFALYHCAGSGKDKAAVLYGIF